MAAFDAAIALSQEQLSQAVGLIYRKVFPNIFTGSQKVDQSGIASVSWSIGAPPQFNLSPTAVQSAAVEISGSLWEQHGATAQDMTHDDVHELVNTSMSIFSVGFPNVSIVLTPQGGGTAQSYQLSNVRAGCYIQVSGNTVSLTVQTVTCDPLSDPTDQFFVKLIILPAIQQALQSALAGLTIPPITLAGVALSTPSVSIVGGYLVAAVNLASKGVPPPAPAGSWVSPYFSLMVSQDLLQRAAAGQGKTFGSSGSGGDHWAGYDWGYSLSLVNPRISFAGPNVNIGFSLAGSIGANAYLLQIPIGLNFTAQAVPNPNANCALIPRNGVLQIVTQSVSPFTVVVTPSGGIPSKIAGWIIAGIIQGVVLSLSPLISQFLGGITISSIDIPTFSQSLAGVKITLTPANLQVVGMGDCLGLGGMLVVS